MRGVLNPILEDENYLSKRKKTKAEIAVEIVEEAELSEAAVDRLSSSLSKHDLEKLLARLRACNE